MFLRTNGRWSIGHFCNENNECACGFKYKTEDYLKTESFEDIRPVICCDVCRTNEMIIKDEQGRYENVNKYLGSKNIKLILVKDNQASESTPINAAVILEINPETIRRWYRDGKTKMHRNGYDVFLNIKKI